MGDDGDLIPVRDQNRRNEDRDGFAARAAQQRRNVAKWPRDDLEDKHLRLYEENLILKKHARKQEDKIKRMATKLLRLVSDKKKEQAESGVGKRGRDIETEEMLEELYSKIRELEKQNGTLKEKLMVTKQQMQTTAKRTTAYGYVPARIHTGIPKAPVDPRIAKNLRVTGPAPVSMSARTGQGQVNQQRYGRSLLEETRAENRHLESIIEQFTEQLNMNDQDIEMLKEQMRIREVEYEDDLLKLKQQMSAGQKTAIQENIDTIRLQREVKEKSSRLTQLQGQYGNLEEKLRTVRGSHDQVLGEMEKLNNQLKDEQNKVLLAQQELKSGSANQRRMVELQERISDMDKECEILREANEKLVSSAFDLEREREWRQRENALKVQIAQLEATLKADVGEKGSILDKLSGERETVEKMEDDHRELRIKYFQVKEECDDLKEKMKFFTKESAVDFGEIEEALMLIKSRKVKENENLDFLEKVDEEKVKDYGKLVRELQAEHAETIHELEKTRNMLIVQHNINKDYQMEVLAVTKKMEDNKAEYESKLEEYAQLLDIRAARIRKLEHQLRDVAYGTKQYRLQPAEDEGSDVEEFDETIHLERGQNMFEIHIKRVVLSPAGLKQLDDEEPSIFATWEFYEYEIQATPVMKGPQPEYQFTSQYLVKVDDFFLHYVQKDGTTLELHQSFGTDFRTVAACQLKMRDILESSSGRVHGTAQLTGVDNGDVGVNYGVVEYWVRLRVPMAQALRLYKERSKALGYIQSNKQVAEQALEAMDEAVAKRPPDNVNELHIKVIRCEGVKARREGVQPSPYVVYKFFDFSDHDTTIVPGSNNPQYNDHKMFPVPMTADLDKYLKSEALTVYVFDDTDPEETTYLGMAKVPLLPLAHDKVVKGIFELKRKDETVNGSVEVHLKWQYTYLPPKASTRTAAQLRQESTEPPERLPLMPGEEEALQQSVVAGAPGTMLPTTPARRMPPPRSRGASATSTPVPLRQPPERPLRTTAPASVRSTVPEVQITEPTPRALQEPEVPSPLSVTDTLEPVSQAVLTSTPSPIEDDEDEDLLSEVSEGSHVTGESESVSDLEDAEMTGPQAGPLPIDVSISQTASPSILEDSMETGVRKSAYGNNAAKKTEQPPFKCVAKRPAGKSLPEPMKPKPSQLPVPADRSWPHLATNLSATLEDGTEEDDEEEDEITEGTLGGTSKEPFTATYEPESVMDTQTETDNSREDEAALMKTEELGETTSEMDMTETFEAQHLPVVRSPKPTPRRTLTRDFKLSSELDKFDESFHNGYAGGFYRPKATTSKDEPELTETQTTETDKTESEPKGKDKKAKKDKKKDDKKKDQEELGKDKGKDKKGKKDEEEEEEPEEEAETKKKPRFSLFGKKDKKDKEKEKSKDKSKDKGKDKSKDDSIDKDKKSKSKEKDSKDKDAKGKDKDKSKGKDKDREIKDKSRDADNDDDDEDEGTETKKTKSRFSLFGNKDKKEKEDKKEKDKKVKKDKKDKNKKVELAEDLATEETEQNEDEEEIPEDTMFGEEEEDEDDVSVSEMEATGTQSIRSPRGGESEDSEGVIVSHATGSRPGSRLSQQGNPDTVTVMISQVTFEEDADLLERDDVQMLFVEYRFLGVSLEETETPFSLPKPKANIPIQFNFRKVFHLDFEENYERRQYLASMLLPEDPEQGRVKFTIVSEPPQENDDGECEDVGTAYVSMPEILKKGKDLIDEDLPVYDVADPDRVIGQIRLTVESLAALQTVKHEMDQTGEESTA